MIRPTLSSHSPGLPVLPTLTVLVSLTIPVFTLPLLAAGCSIVTAGTIAGVVTLVFAVIVLTRQTTVSAPPRIALGVWMVLSLMGGYRLAHLGVFMLDVQRYDHAIDPPLRPMDDPSMERPFDKHNCFTCYVIAAHLADARVDNLYDRELYRDTKTPTDIHMAIGKSVTIDTYQYPPQFLLLPRALMIGNLDFFKIRTLWFAFNVALIAVTFFAVVRYVNDGQFGPLWLMWPVVTLASTTLLSLQMGNVHLIIVCLCVLAMIALERDHPVIGGLVLGYVICAKVFPGVLLVVLLAARRWRSATATVLAMLMWTVVTFVVFGPNPFEAFGSEQMPRLASGQAFSFAFTILKPLVVNSSIMGIPYKLRELGLLSAGATPDIARITMAGYTVALLVLLVVAGCRLRAATADSAWNRLLQVQMIVVVIILGQLRSPFLPWPYGHFAVLLLLPLVAAARPTLWSMWLVVLWLCLADHVPLRWGPRTATLDLIYTLTVQAAVGLLCVSVLLRRRAPTLEPEA